MRPTIPPKGPIAKRRSAATLISYLTPPVTNAGLYKGLSELKSSLDRLRNLEDGEDDWSGQEAFDLIQVQADQLDLNRDVSPLDPACLCGCGSRRRCWNWNMR
jgi:magnesium chelatase subunit H